MKKLYKSTSDKLALGVIGGLSAALNIPSGPMRFVFFILTVSKPEATILCYLAIAFILPSEEEVHFND
ncbi:PspC domain-containing protein [Guptibacillus algicola]|uniref:PspC domain-containing protein n=1 Tax=Guptibacillus algicola TaxID=225844 RepID=UPI001CD6210E|nr:PspC domain-containing protein [Alkalihalobacillus algicola]MCA0988551.1 PspC domain-containing protein [Alkalihalobacillus algicola]